MEYKIVHGDIATLEKQVNELMTDGWEPAGFAYGMNNTHYQPMILRDDTYREVTGKMETMETEPGEATQINPEPVKRKNATR